MKGLPRLKSTWYDNENRSILRPVRNLLDLWRKRLIQRKIDLSINKIKLYHFNVVRSKIYLF